MDPYQRDTSPRAGEAFLRSLSHRIGYSIAPGFAPLKIDVWGNPIPSNRGEMIGNEFSDALVRIVDPTNLTIGAKIDPIDRYIYNWNNMAGDDSEKIQIQPIDDKIKGDFNGKRGSFPLSVKEQTEANQNAGRTARAVLGEDWDWKNPTKEGADMIIQAVRDAQREQRAILRVNKQMVE
jgi:hypothetical protein